MSTGHLLCMGFGYTAAALARSLAGDGSWRLTGTTRSAEKAEELAEQGVDVMIWHGGSLAPQSLEAVDALLISAGPDEHGCPAYHAVASAVLARQVPLRWIGYLSSTAVYGDHEGAWVDEQTPLRAVSSRARYRVTAEHQWRELGERTGAPTVVFRLSGIYGPGRSAIDTVRRGTARRIDKPGQVFNRAHVDDIAAALRASLASPSVTGLVNIADDMPAPPQDVIAYACELLNVAPPPLIAYSEAALSEAARRFYEDNKRVANTRMKTALGVAPAYPSYREGLRAILTANDG